MFWIAQVASTDGWDCKQCADGSVADSCRCDATTSVTGGLSQYFACLCVVCL